MDSELIYKKQHKSTCETDSYAKRYIFEGENFRKSIWENPPSVGPCSWNIGCIDLILYNSRNGIKDIYGGKNAIFQNKRAGSLDIAKFEP